MISSPTLETEHLLFASQRPIGGRTLLAGLIDEFFRKYAIANTLMLLAGISGTSAFYTGIIGIIKSKDRSVIVFTATIIGFFILLVSVIFREPGW